MQSHRVGAIRRPRREHAGQGRVEAPARVYLQHVAPGRVQPGEHNQLVARRDADKPLRNPSCELQPGFGSALVSLKRRGLATGRLGAYDAYWFDQSACSSPRALICCGPRTAAIEGARRLLRALARVIEHRGYRAAPATALAKRLYAERLAIDSGASGLEWFSNELVAFEVSSLDALRQREHCGGGLFLLLHASRLEQLSEQVTSRDQSLTYFGFEAAELQALARSVQGRGLDRIVPVGKALELSHVWDGYDLLESFTRARDLRINLPDAQVLAAAAGS